ncbi:MAG: hypothetical protein ACM3O7_12530 [Acidobacteriota bacterium]
MSAHRPLNEDVVGKTLSRPLGLIGGDNALTVSPLPAAPERTRRWARRSDARPLRRWWESHKCSAFPAGAHTFHIEAWTRRTLTPPGAEAARQARESFGFDEFLVLHGSAWLADGTTTLVCGPPGIGKSTVLRSLQDMGRGRLIEDGLLLVGVSAETWHLVLTGATEVLDRASRIGRRIRELMLVDFSLFQDPNPEAMRRAHPVRAALLLRLSGVSFTLAAALGPRPNGSFSPSHLEITRLVVAHHPLDPSPSLRLHDRGPAQEVADLRSATPAGVAVMSVCPFGTLTEIRQRLRDALLCPAS